MKFDFAGKVVLVTGAASGIGSTIARRFAESGATVLATDVNEAGLDDVGRELGDRCRTRRMDAASDAEIADGLAWIRREIGRLDVVINNAGLAVLESIATLSEAAIDKQFAVLVKGPMLITKQAAPLLEAAPAGAMINIASVAAIGQARNQSVYNTCKAAIVKFTRDTACEHRGFRCNAILPGFIDTPILEIYGTGAAFEALMKDVVEMTPVGRVGTTDDIASASLFLCSPLASFITGASLVVDGGLTLHPLK